MNNKRLKAEHVEHLYGVPRNERRLLREILNTTALYANRKVVDIRGLKTPKRIKDSRTWINIWLHYRSRKLWLYTERGLFIFIRSS